MPVADAQQIEEPQGSGGRRLWPRRWRTRIAAGIAAVAIVGGSASWIDRNRIVRDIVDAWGGHLELVDSPLGGLCVHIQLPQPSLRKA